jgi:bud emergence protein 1
VVKQGGAQQAPQQPQMFQQQRGPPSVNQPAQFAPGSDLPGPVSASIPRYCFAEDKYWFVIDTILDDGRHWELSRYYEDFYDFQIALLTEFPAEAGNTGTQKRTLPYMPGPVNYVTDAITEGRLHNLDAYVKNLLAQPPYIAKCTLVRQFFAPREGDYEIGPETDGDYRLSDGSHPSSNENPGGDSRQGSKNNLNGNGYGNMGDMRQMGNMPAQSPYMSQPSQSSLNAGMSQGASAMKVKLCYNDEVVAIRVATDIPFEQLYEKVRERLKIPPANQISISYKDEATGDRPPLMNNTDLDYALNRNEKLLLYVDLV